MSSFLEQWKEQAERYRRMTLQELEALPDDALFEAILARLEAMAEQKESLADALYAFNDQQLAFFAANWYEGEVNNGGLCQFFVNSSSIVAPIMSDVLRHIGAEEHSALFTNFVQRNGIDLKDLSSFKIRDFDEFEAQTQRYPFDDFDDVFYQLEPVQRYLTAFARAHLKELA